MKHLILSGATIPTPTKGGKYVNYAEAANKVSYFDIVDPIKAGDIVLWDGTKKITVSPDNYNTTIYPTATYTPIGVIAIPEGHHPIDGKARMVSIKFMDRTNPAVGNSKSTENAPTWGMKGSSNLDVPALTSRDKVVAINNGTVITNAATKVEPLSSTSNSTITMAAHTSMPDPSGDMHVVINQFDPLTTFSYSDSMIALVPSPYKEDGSKNTVYSQTTAPSSADNILKDFNGYENTRAIINQITGDTDGDVYSDIHTCYNAFVTPGTTAGEWYLPSAGEIGYYIARYDTIMNSIKKVTPDIATFGDISLWTSTQTDSSFAVAYIYPGLLKYEKLNGLPSIAMTKL